MQTILGANGTIGTVLAKELSRYTDKVRLVSRQPKKINATDELFPADLSDPSRVDKAVAGSEVVYLLVGFDYDIKVWREKWPKLMRATIDACIKHKAKLVFFDNIYLYDISAIGHMTEASPVNPPSEKGLVRKEIAGMVVNGVKTGKLTALIARSADFYGPHNERSFLNEVMYNSMKKGSRPKWFVDADKKHSFTYTPDAAKATALLGNTPDAYNEVWHLPTDRNALTGREMAALFMKEMNVQSKIQVLPLWMIRLIGLFVPFMREMPEMMYQYDRDYVFDSGKFEERFGVQPTSYAQGVKEIVGGGRNVVFQRRKGTKKQSSAKLLSLFFAVVRVLKQLSQGRQHDTGHRGASALPGSTISCKPATYHSSRRHFVGLSLATFIACAPTVNHAMKRATKPAAAKYHTLNSILKAKRSSQLLLIA